MRSRVSLITVLPCALAVGYVRAQETEPASRPESMPSVRIAGKCEPSDGKDLGPTPIRVTLWRQDFVDEMAEVVGEVRAGESRSFAFDGVRWFRGRERGSVGYLLIARQGRDRIGFKVLRGDQCDPGKAELDLMPTRTVRGKVADAKGKPLADAAVSVRFLGDPQERGFAYLTAPVPHWTVRTDTSGVFELAGLPRKHVTIFVTHAIHAQCRFEVEAERAEVETIDLEPGAVICGRVRFPDGRPADRVIVQAQSVKTSAWARTWTKEDGSYRLESLPIDAFNVWAKVPDWTVVAHASLEVEPGRELAAGDLVLTRGGFISGRVIDEQTGKPVCPGEWSDVGLYGPSRPRAGAAIESAPIREDGTFEIRAAPGSNYIYLRAHGWGRASQDVEVKEGQKVEVEFRVERQGKPK